MIHTGLVSISFRKLSPQQIIEAVKAAGLTCVEWGSDVHAPCNDPERLQEIAKLQEESGIFCSSYGTYFRIGVTPIEEFPAYIQAAKTLGTNILRLWCGNKSPENYTDEEKESIYAQSRELAKMAEAAGVILCMECHPWTLTERADTAYALMQAVDSPAFRMYYQPNQFMTTADNIAYAKLLAPYTYHLHVFNWEGEKKFPLAEAIDKWKTYLSCFEGDRALLLEFMPDGKIETLPVEAKALFEIIGGNAL